MSGSNGLPPEGNALRGVATAGQIICYIRYIISREYLRQIYGKANDCAESQANTECIEGRSSSLCNVPDNCALEMG